MNELTLRFWEVIGAWVAAFATLTAVVVSLWLALSQSKVKLKINAGHRLLLTEGQKETPDYCYINIVNISPKPAKIVSVGWQVGLFKKRYFYQKFGIPESAQVPVTLQQDGDEATFLLPFHFRSDDQDWIVHFPQSIFNGHKPKIQLMTLCVLVYTSVGQKFKVKVEDNLKEKLLESYEANKSLNQTGANDVSPG